MASDKYERDVELAHERGFDSLYDERMAIEDATDRLAGLGIDDATFDERLEYAQALENFEPGSHDREYYQDLFEDLFDVDWNDDEDLFWEWLDEFYKHG